MENLEIIKLVVLLLGILFVMFYKLKYKLSILYYFASAMILGKLIVNGSLFMAVIAILLIVLVEVSIFVHPKKEDLHSMKSNNELKIIKVLVYLSVTIVGITAFTNPEIFELRKINLLGKSSNSITSGLILFMTIAFYQFYKAKPWK